MIKKAMRPVKSRIHRDPGGKKRNDTFESRVSRHFLFNSLNSVIALCHKNPEAAAQLVGEISTYLQKSLEDKSPLIPLEEELEQGLAYLNIQKARFSHRLKIVLDIDDGIRCAIPPFTLQPLIENAVSHGALKRKGVSTVSLSIKKLPHSLAITVKDDGPGMTEEQLNLLLKNGNRQHSLYKVDHALKTAGFEGLEIRSGHDRGTAVAMELPYNF